MTLNCVSIADQGCAGMLVPGGAALAAGKMMSWFWLDISPVQVFACWAGIRLRRVIIRREAERSGQGKSGFALRRLSDAGTHRSGFLPGGTPAPGTPSPHAWILTQGHEDPERIASASGHSVVSV